VALTLNKRILDHARLTRQFRAAQVIASAIPVKVLAYLRSTNRIFEVCDALRRDLENV
jgi:hypothetical protein